MDEYIKREDLLELYRIDDPVLNENGHVPLPVIRQNIMDIPAADVAPMVHGQWETSSDIPASLIGSVCKCGLDMWKHDPHNFCPNCGAKMDGGDNDASD